MAESESEAATSVGRSTTQRQYGFYCWGLVTSLVLIGVVIIVCVILLVESDNSVLILSILIVLLLLVGISVGCFIEWQRRKAARKRDDSAKAWIHRTLSESRLDESRPPQKNSWRWTNRDVNRTRQTFSPSAPSQSARSSWAFWRKSSSTNGNRIVKPSAPPQSARTTLVQERNLPSTQGPPRYDPVASDGETVMQLPPS